ncbi:unnamed protein product [Oikopleura dioica]|uniref:Uncharacterized protein n=1 Tax=Oikopleura dioica TaxID=34765 RepID=E4XBL5_OIKDI|nr:unnamed protein product [Oikopleura dioica]
MQSSIICEPEPVAVLTIRILLNFLAYPFLRVTSTTTDVAARMDLSTTMAIQMKSETVDLSVLPILITVRDLLQTKSRIT